MLPHQQQTHPHACINSVSRSHASSRVHFTTQQLLHTTCTLPHHPATVSLLVSFKCASQHTALSWTPLSSACASADSHKSTHNDTLGCLTACSVHAPACLPPRDSTHTHKQPKQRQTLQPVQLQLQPHQALWPLSSGRVPAARVRRAQTQGSGCRAHPPPPPRPAQHSGTGCAAQHWR